MLTFYPSRIPDPGVKKAPDPGSATLLKTLQFCVDPLVSVNCYVILTPPYTVTTRAVFSHYIPVKVLCCAVAVQVTKTEQLNN
jgi:hypothetical protein